MIKMLLVLWSLSSSVAQPAQQTQFLPQLEDYEFAPDLHTVYYSSSPSSYTSIIQFFNIRGEEQWGRFCRLDANHKPFECIRVVPNTSTQTCTLQAYREREGLPVTRLERTDGNYRQMLFSSGVRDEDRSRVRNAVARIQTVHVGSARHVAVPQGVVVPFHESLNDIQIEHNTRRGQVTADATLQGQMACHEYFRRGGAQFRMNSEASDHRRNCEQYNISARRMGSPTRDCSTYQYRRDNITIRSNASVH